MLDPTGDIPWDEEVGSEDVIHIDSEQVCTRVSLLMFVYCFIFWIILSKAPLSIIARVIHVKCSGKKWVREKLWSPWKWLVLKSGIGKKCIFQ